MEIDNQPKQPQGGDTPPQNPSQPPVGGPTPPQGPEPTPQGPLPPLPDNPQTVNQPQHQTQSKTDVLGIISLVMILILPLVGMILGFIGINKAKKEGYPKTLSLIGAIVNTILVILGTILISIIVLGANDAINEYAQELDEYNETITSYQEESNKVTYVSDVGKVCATGQWPDNFTSSTSGNIVGVFSNSQSYPDTYSTEYLTLEDEYESISSSTPTEVDTIVCISSVDQPATRVVECDLKIDDEEIKAPMSLRPYQATVYDVASQDQIGTFTAQPEDRCPFFVTVDPDDNSFDAGVDQDSFNSGLETTLQ